MKNALLKGFGVLTAAAALCGQSAFGALVYDNTTTRLPSRYGNISGFEFGDEITLDSATKIGGFTLITNFSIEYFGTNFTGDETMRVRIYAMTGPTNATSGGFATPAAGAIYDSGNFNIASSPGATLNFDNLSISVPDRIAWTVEFGAVSAGELAGLDVYSPPTVGNNFDDFWQRSTPAGAWELRTLPGSVANFGARFQAVPEPSTLALSGLALLGLAAARRKFRRS